MEGGSVLLETKALVELIRPLHPRNESCITNAVICCKQTLCNISNTSGGGGNELKESKHIL